MSEHRMWRDPAVPIDEIPASLAALMLQQMATTLLACAQTYRELPADMVSDAQRLGLIRATDQVEFALDELEFDDRVTGDGPDLD